MVLQDAGALRELDQGRAVQLILVSRGAMGPDWSWVGAESVEHSIRCLLHQPAQAPAEIEPCYSQVKSDDT